MVMKALIGEEVPNLTFDVVFPTFEDFISFKEKEKIKEIYINVPTNNIVFNIDEMARDKLDTIKTINDIVLLARRIADNILKVIEPITRSLKWMSKKLNKKEVVVFFVEEGVPKQVKMIVFGFVIPLDAIFPILFSGQRVGKVGVALIYDEEIQTLFFSLALA